MAIIRLYIVDITFYILGLIHNGDVTTQKKAF